VTGEAIVSLYDHVKADIDALLADYRSRAADGITLKDVYSLGTEAVARFMQLVERFGGAGVDKKAAVMAAAARFYDDIIAPIDLPGPDVVVEKIARQVWLYAVDAAVDGLVRVLFPK
jgi:hypothetical protein